MTKGIICDSLSNPNNLLVGEGRVTLPWSSIYTGGGGKLLHAKEILQISASQMGHLA